jgi:hypothetical protein
MRPSEVRKMRWSEVTDLTTAWADAPPTHVGVVQLRDVVISGLGGTPPSRRALSDSGAVVANGKATSPEAFAAMLGVSLEATSG